MLHGLRKRARSDGLREMRDVDISRMWPAERERERERARWRAREGLLGTKLNNWGSGVGIVRMYIKSSSLPTLANTREHAPILRRV
jgi:hypothetical protein